MIEQILILLFSIFLVIRGATLATKYSAQLAEHFNISRYVISFIIVAFVGILPETMISINSALQGVPEFGLGTLFGANIADLTLIFALLIFLSGRSIKIESKILKNIKLYPFFLLLPVTFGLDGDYTRIDGIALILSGILFYYLIFSNNSTKPAPREEKTKKHLNILFLALSMILLVIGAHFIVESATKIAEFLKVSPILIGLLVVSLGTTMPELFYSVKAVQKEEDTLAIGDLMGTVLANATIIVGLIAVINPFTFPVKIIYVTGIFMVIASLILLKFMKSGRTVTKKEGLLLFFFWIAYALIEIIINQ